MKPVIIGDATLYLGDCLEILPTLGKVDAVVTDPPYGIGYVHGAEKGKFATKFAGVSIANDDKPFDPSSILGIAPKNIFWGGNHYAERLPAGRWIVWDKRMNIGCNDHSDCEIAWTDCLTTDRMIWHRWSGWGRDSERNIPRVHPTQKPIIVMERCLGFLPDAHTILDPFMGSGTTGVACAKLGRKFIGIEIEEKYFQIACRRIEDAYKQPDFFVEPPKKAVQEPLL